MADVFVLLDRDGTIIHDKHYLSDPEGVELLPGAAEGLRRLTEMGCKLAVLTNQSGVGRGYYTHADVKACNERMAVLLAPHGVVFEGVFYCPHAPEDGCDCRKPKPGMVEQAIRAHGFDPSTAFMVGDKEADMGVGKKTGATTILVRTGKGAEHEARCHELADHVVNDLRDVADLIGRLLQG